LPATLGGALDVDGAEARAFRLELAALRERAEAMRPTTMSSRQPTSS